MTTAHDYLVGILTGIATFTVVMLICGALALMVVGIITILPDASRLMLDVLNGSMDSHPILFLILVIIVVGTIYGLINAKEWSKR